MSTLREKLKRIDQIREGRPGCGDILDFFEQVFIARDAVLQNLTVTDPYQDGHGIDQRLREGFPLLEKRHFQYDAAALANYFSTVLDIVARRNPGGAAAIRLQSEAAGRLLKNLPPGDIVK
jgi:formate dehydrogenase maturation protein FdhE